MAGCWPAKRIGNCWGGRSSRCATACIGWGRRWWRASYRSEKKRVPGGEYRLSALRGAGPLRGLARQGDGEFAGAGAVRARLLPLRGVWTRALSLGWGVGRDGGDAESGGGGSGLYRRGADAALPRPVRRCCPSWRGCSWRNRRWSGRTEAAGQRFAAAQAAGK